ncbi:CCC motif membrane protein [Nonlabens ponticola]|uniref:DUF4190 domain-containing protein n=1 Tax=Nonlabens ponticola TaxID=2496866 RepID=A0A3S9MWZ4_9FLAO|nr:CCC motif membrane protein [Nonlabens ponticola]AZQ43766.1 hypothetical protein EJ995_05810 [Nonlabens ponticola]
MQKLNTTSVYTLSALGILGCCFGLGIVPAIIALMMANSGLRKIKRNPDIFSNGDAMRKARKVALASVTLCSIMVALIAYHYIAYSEEERIERQVEIMETLGLPDTFIEQSKNAEQADEIDAPSRKPEE